MEMKFQIYEKLKIFFGWYIRKNYCMAPITWNIVLNALKSYWLYKYNLTWIVFLIVLVSSDADLTVR